MLRLFLLVAARNLRRNLGFTTLNVVGLALGLACVLLIGLYVIDELRFDRFHPDADRVVWVTADIVEAGERDPTSSTQGVLAPSIEADISDVEAVVRLNRAGAIYTLDGQPYRVEDVQFADGSLFDVFGGFRATEGALDLSQPGQMILTSSLGSRLFGEQSPVGRTLGSANGPVTVVGVIEDLPTASTLQFSALISSTTMDPPAWMYDNWSGFAFDTYAKLQPGVSVERFEAQMAAMVDARIGAEMDAEGRQLELGAVPLLDARLRSGRPGGHDATALWILGAIGLFVLALACVNFTNLSTARSLERGHEVGVRKALGAGRASLVAQFLAEAVVLSLVALALAVVLVQTLAPWAESITGKALSLATLGWGLPGAAALAVATGLLAGAHPALALSHVQPTEALRGRLASGARSAALRRGLVIFQFTVTVVLLTGTATVFDQLRYMQGRDLGFGPEGEAEHLVTLDFAGDDAVAEQLDAFKASLEAVPGVEGAASSMSRLARGQSSAAGEIEGSDGTAREMSVSFIITDAKFADVHGLEVVAGRQPRMVTTDSSLAEYLLNESALREAGYASADEVIGKPAAFWGFEGTVVGVVRDFHTMGLQSAIQPLAISALPLYQTTLTLRVRAGDAGATLDRVEEVWSEFAPALPYEPVFLDDAFGELYGEERQVGQVVGLFSILAVAIACLGLFGLAAHAAVQRRREIGVRRALGASVAQVVGLLTRDTVVLVGVSILIGVPVAVWLMETWLTEFAYRTTIGPGLVLGVALLVLAVSTATVSSQAVRAATADPVRSLRAE
ncbi:MAG: ABC transporter permease [Bacteroidota bacterium]